MTLRLKFLFTLLTLVAFSACGQKKSPSKSGHGSDDATAGGFIDANDFQLDDSVDAIDANQAAKIISAIDFFYFQKGKSTLALEDTTESQCEIKTDSVTVSSDGKSLELSYVFDDSNCPDTQDKYINKMTVYASISCSDTSLADYAGKSARGYLSTNGAKDFCGKDKTQKTFINAQYERTSADESAKTLGGMMKSDGSACMGTFDNGTYKMDDCLFVQKTTTTKADKTSATSKLIRLQAKNLTSSASGRYYSAGTVDMQINRWKGTMTYSADNTAPTYDLNSDGAKAKGSFTAGIYE